MIAVNKPIEVNRFMDQYEKTQVRKECASLLEDRIPHQEKRLQQAENAFNEAKKHLASCKTEVSASISELKTLGVEVKRGTRAMSLDEQFTYRVSFRNMYFFYTFVDSQLKLAKVKDIPDHEKSEIWNAQEKNETFIADNFGSDIPFVADSLKITDEEIIDKDMKNPIANKLGGLLEQNKPLEENEDVKTEK